MPGYGHGDVEEVALEVMQAQLPAQLTALGVGAVAPIVRYVNDGDAQAGTPELIKIYGTYFTLGSIVKIDGVAVSPVTFIDDNQLRVDYNGSVGGTFDLSVTTAGGVGTKSNAVLVSGDALALLLSTSLVAYDAAASNEWVEITENEYNSLAANIASLVKVGSTDSQYASDVSGGQTSTVTWCNNDAPLVPAGGYLFAFKKRNGANEGNCTGELVLSSTAGAGGPLSPVGGASVELPSHASTTSNHSFFVLKDAPMLDANDDSWIGFYCNNSRIDYDFGSGLNANFETYNFDATPSNNGNYHAFYQGLSTTVKQW